MSWTRPARRHLIGAIEDSRRWDHVDPRPDDIVISTPPKSGTTWTQGMVLSMLWPDGDTPAPLGEISPWIDARFLPIEDLVARVEAQTHRRFLKTHSPADCIPINETGRYVVVYRDGRDALVSWSNHRAKMRPEIIEFLNDQAAADGVEPLPPVWDGDMDVLFDEWIEHCSSVTHLAAWWPLRDEAFVCFVHYADLLEDLDGEMRRLADFLGIDVPEESWPAVVERCHITNMREAARNSTVELVFEGGADSFFHKGVNGRWVEVLTDDHVERYRRTVAEELPDDAATWLECGSLALGTRPDGAIC